MKKIFFSVFILFAYSVYGNNNALLNEYKLLYIDLLNLRTWGYKSFYDGELNRTNGYINTFQGAIQITGNNFDYVIHGEGFFKIRLDNNSVAYTRSGNFRVDSAGVLVTPQGYPLYENIRLEGAYLWDSFRITKDHNIYVNIVDRNNETIERQLGQLLTYKIPHEYLEHYDGAIYTIKENIEYEDDITFDNSLIMGALECSNYELLPVIIRMYYILSLSDENLIRNVEFKKELLKIQIENMSDNNLLDTEIEEEYLNSKFYYLEKILPYIRHDY
jgi:flagellar basal body rod protein FlgF